LAVRGRRQIGGTRSELSLSFAYCDFRAYDDFLSLQEFYIQVSELTLDRLLSRADRKRVHWQEIYGTLQAKLWAVEAQVDALASKIGSILIREDRASVTDTERGEIAVRIAGAKVTSTDVALEVTNK